MQSAFFTFTHPFFLHFPVITNNQASSTGAEDTIVFYKRTLKKKHHPLRTSVQPKGGRKQRDL